MPFFGHFWHFFGHFQNCHYFYHFHYPLQAPFWTFQKYLLLLIHYPFRASFNAMNLGMAYQNLLGKRNQKTILKMFYIHLLVRQQVLYPLLIVLSFQIPFLYHGQQYIQYIDIHSLALVGFQDLLLLGKQLGLIHCNTILNLSCGELMRRYY